MRVDFLPIWEFQQRSLSQPLAVVYLVLALVAWRHVHQARRAGGQRQRNGSTAHAHGFCIRRAMVAEITPHQETCIHAGFELKRADIPNIPTPTGSHAMDQAGDSTLNTNIC